jgi:formate dehydrogenase iron-sulfur subunit
MVAPRKPDSLDSFLAELLADQQRLITPAARASAVFDAQPPHLRGEAFRDLIPLSAPGPGERYAFEVDLDACSGCKACVVACHCLNGLDETESFRDVGLVLGTESCGAPFQQTVTSACHHCEDPGCLNGCPVLAYEQDPVTGIVRHLDDQCIGCSYCVLKCPYDVPKYNERLGIVRKCDMCHGRLAEGEAPACAQACPTHAIKIIKVPVVTESPSPLLASAAVPSPAITTPTTRYISKKPLPTVLRSADARALRLQHAHYALVFLLTFTQLALGLLIASLLSSLPTSSFLLPTSFLFFAAGLGASVAHLGQPLRAWRVFLGLRKSWLSREAVILGAAFPLVALATLASLPPAWLPLPASLSDLLTSHFSLLTSAAIAVTAAGVFCSAMIYIDTKRSFWRPSQSFGRMAGTALIAALAPIYPLAAALILLAKLALELSTLRGDSASARLQRGPLAPLVVARVAIALLTLTVFLLPTSSFLLLLPLFALGELLERTLFFRAVDSPKMPGVPSA